MVIDVAVAGIGGSEYLGYRNPGLRPLPNIMGHGIAGVAPDGGRVAVNPLRSCGACAFCRRGQAQLCDSWSLIGVQSPGGFAQKLAVPEDSLVALPDSITWDQASFIEPFANAVNAWDLAQADPSAAIAVLGAGSLGLGVVASASAAGCKIIQVSDNSAPRLAAAATLGAEAISKQMTDTYDIVFDTVGSAESR
ncbi:alcohol dehydrogenase catalytic domain-containing protein [Pelagibius sp.]|uniref:alcohol dehydrogenase catalytic domain-containing protein n=1 Tax=Pelagibius sp. TaxID=1931238 RepID=UPI003BAE2B6E